MSTSPTPIRRRLSASPPLIPRRLRGGKPPRLSKHLSTGSRRSPSPPSDSRMNKAFTPSSEPDALKRSPGSATEGDLSEGDLSPFSRAEKVLADLRPFLPSQPSLDSAGEVNPDTLIPLPKFETPLATQQHPVPSPSPSGSRMSPSSPLVPPPDSPHTEPNLSPLERNPGASPAQSFVESLKQSPAPSPFLSRHGRTDKEGKMLSSVGRAGVTGVSNLKHHSKFRVEVRSVGVQTSDPSSKALDRLSALTRETLADAKSSSKSKRRAKKSKAVIRSPPPECTVFDSHAELLRLFEFAACHQAYNSAFRVLKDLPVRDWLNVPDIDGARECVGELAHIHEDLAVQAKHVMETPAMSSMYCFADLPQVLQEHLVCLADLWREKVALDRAFLSAVYRDRLNLLKTVQAEIEELIGSVSLQAREARRHYLLSMQRKSSARDLVARTADHLNSVLDKTAMCVRKARHRVQALMADRYAQRDTKYQQAKDIIDEEEENIIKQSWQAAKPEDRAELSTCLRELESHVQLAYTTMQQRLLQGHLEVLVPLVHVTSCTVE